MTSWPKPAAVSCPAGLCYGLSFVTEPQPRLELDLAFETGDWAETRLRLPEGGDADDRRWELISDLEIEGAFLERCAGAQLWLKHAPYARIRVRYAVASGYERHAPDPYKPRLSRQSALFIGERVIALPNRWLGDRCQVAWRRRPRGWEAGTSVRAPQACSARDLLEGVFYAAARGQIQEAGVAGQPSLKIVSLGESSAVSAEVRRLAGRLLPATEHFWQSPHELRLLIVASVASHTLAAHAVGRVFAGAVLFLLDVAATPDGLDFLVAHELTHAWCPGRLTSTSRITPADYWFSEGLTDSFAARTLIVSGLWSARDFAEHLNRRLQRYAASRYRATSLSALLACREDPSAFRHLYDRGCLLATKWGLEIWDDSAAAPGTRDAAVRTLARESAAAASGAAGPFLSELAAMHPGDLPGDVVRHIERGAPIALRAPAGSRLVRLRSRRAPVFGLGFERRRRDDGRWEVTAVAPGSGADVAGLRPGDVLRALSGASQVAEPRVQVLFADRDACEPPTTFSPTVTRSVIAQSLEILSAGPQPALATADQCLIAY